MRCICTGNKAVIDSSAMHVVAHVYPLRVPFIQTQPGFHRLSMWAITNGGEDEIEKMTS